MHISLQEKINTLTSILSDGPSLLLTMLLLLFPEKCAKEKMLQIEQVNKRLIPNTVSDTTQEMSCYHIHTTLLILQQPDNQFKMIIKQIQTF